MVPLTTNCNNRSACEKERGNAGGYCNQCGFTLVGALALIAVMSIFMALSVPLWSWVKQRDNEEELIFRGKEYVEAIGRYHAKFGTYPPDMETLEKLKFIRRLYKDPMTESGKWKVLHPDTLVQTGAAGKINVPGQKDGKDKKEKKDGGENQPGVIPSGFSNENQLDDKEEEEERDEDPEVESVGPVVGVVSRSKKTSIKTYNGQTTYNKWVFAYAIPQQPQQQTPQGRSGPGGKPGPGKDGGQRPPPQEDDNEAEE